MRPLYVSATLQDCGKTSVTLGLLQFLREQNQSAGYIKPVGQRYVHYNGENLDEDAVLVYEYFGMKDNPKDLSPIAIERGFTRKFIYNPDVKPLENRVVGAMDRLKAAHELVIIEGTGHAGVGSCFGLSNARVAELTGSDVVIVTSGGIGKPLDEIAVSLSLFREHGVRVLGVILNKVLPEKYDKVKETVARGLENLGTRLIGAIPFSPTLKNYTLGQVADAFGYEVVCGGKHLGNKIENIVVAAMEPENVLEYIRQKSLVITPGDRIDNVLLAMLLSQSVNYHERFCSGGLILTGGLLPPAEMMELVKKGEMPVLATKEDTFTVTSRMKDLAFKIQINDRDKIEATKSLVEEHLDVDFVLNELKKPL